MNREFTQTEVAGLLTRSDEYWLSVEAKYREVIERQSNELARLSAALRRIVTCSLAYEEPVSRQIAKEALEGK